MRAAATSGTSLFDGKTLDGWIQIENSATSLPSGSITDPAAFAARLANGSDAVSAFLRGRVTDPVKADLAAFSAASPDAKTVISALAKELNQVIAGPSIYDQARFGGIVLRPETAQLLRQNPRGRQLARLNKLLLEDAYPAELAKSAAAGWIVKDGAMASTGAGPRSDLHGEGLQSLPPDVHHAARLRQSRPSGLRPHFLQPPGGRRAAARCAGGHTVSASQRRTLGLPARHEQKAARSLRP